MSRDDFFDYSTRSPRHATRSRTSTLAAALFWAGLVGVVGMTVYFCATAGG